MQFQHRKLSQQDIDELSRLISHVNRRLSVSLLDHPFTKTLRRNSSAAGSLIHRQQSLSFVERRLLSSKLLLELSQAAFELAASFEAWERWINELEADLKEAEEILIVRTDDALKMMKVAAGNGLAEAQYKLGKVFMQGLIAVGTGLPVKPSLESKPEIGFRLMSEAALQGHNVAKLECAICHFRGFGAPKDVKIASKLAQECLPLLEADSKEGNPSSTAQLASCYLWGLGVPVNHMTAFHLFEEAADGGDVLAKTLLGICRYDGIGMDRKSMMFDTLDTAASFWFKNASESGRSAGLASLALGECLHRGFSVDSVDDKAAREYFVRGLAFADRSDPVALCFVAQCLFHGYVSKDPENTAKAVQMWEVSSKAGYWRSQWWLGWCYFNGICVEASKKQAFYWWKQSAGSGFWLGQRLLSECYLAGEGVSQDTVIAEDLWKKSTVQFERFKKDKNNGMAWMTEYSILKSNPTAPMKSVNLKSADSYRLPDMTDDMESNYSEISSLGSLEKAFGSIMRQEAMNFQSKISEENENSMEEHLLHEAELYCDFDENAPKKSSSKNRHKAAIPWGKLSPFSKRTPVNNPVLKVGI